jgi:hypothetical protein
MPPLCLTLRTVFTVIGRSSIRTVLVFYRKID